MRRVIHCDNITCDTIQLGDLISNFLATHHSFHVEILFTAFTRFSCRLPFSSSLPPPPSPLLFSHLSSSLHVAASRRTSLVTPITYSLSLSLSISSSLSFPVLLTNEVYSGNSSNWLSFKFVSPHHRLAGSTKNIALIWFLRHLATLPSSHYERAANSASSLFSALFYVLSLVSSLVSLSLLPSSLFITASVTRESGTSGRLVIYSHMRRHFTRAREKCAWCRPSLEGSISQVSEASPRTSSASAVKWRTRLHSK